MGFRTEFKDNLKRIFSYKYVKIGFAVNFIYLVIGFIYYFMSLEPKPGQKWGGNDFTVFYHAGMLAKWDIDNLYNPNEYLYPFRYLPMTGYIFWAIFCGFGFIPEQISFVFFMIANFLINIPIVVLMYQIVFGMFKLDKLRHEKRFLKFIAFYFAFVPHVDNYANGQVNLFVAFFLLSSLYFFEYPNYKERDPGDKIVTHYDLYGGAALGAAMLVKITALILLPFIMIIRIYLKKKRDYPDKMKPWKRVRIKIPIRENFYRLLVPAFVLVMNLYLFIVNPGLYESFSNINFSGSGEQVWTHSFSITRLILNVIEWFIHRTPPPEIAIIVLISVFGPAFAWVFWSYARNMNAEFILPQYYSLGLLTLLVGYYDSWAHHLVVLLPFLIISLIQIRDAVAENGDLKNRETSAVTSEGDATLHFRTPSAGNNVINESGRYRTFNFIYRVTEKDYNGLTRAFILSGLYFWTLFWFVMQLFIKPGLNLFYALIILYIFVKMVLILNRR